MHFSIVICTYNNHASLRQTLRSFQGLRVPTGVAVELWVVDNNSNDLTREAFESLSPAVPFVCHYAFEPKQGLSNARNRGINEASGEFILYTDDDVLVPENWLECYAESLLDCGADAAYGRIVPQWNGPAPWFFMPELRATYALLDYGPRSFTVNDDWQEFFGANFAVRRSLLIRVGGFDARLGRTKGALFVGEERQVFLRLRQLNAKVHYNARNAVQHVIAENRKNTAFLRRYFRDIAASHVCADSLEPRRWIGPMPAYRWRELLGFAVRCPVQLLWALLTANRRRLLFLELRCRTLLRMVALFAALPASSRISRS
jgi:glycosyltransferase involved in cell wall biosynthesis